MDMNFEFRKIMSVVLACSAIVFAIIASYMFGSDYFPILRALASEDGPLQYATAISYFAAGVIFTIPMKDRGIGRLWLLGLALMCFFVAGEEISWGQRLFNISTPSMIENVNVQSELNIHNIDGIHQSIRAVGLLIVGTLYILIPFAAWLFRYARVLVDKLEVPVPSALARLWVVIGISFMLIPRLIDVERLFSLDEVGETYLAVGFLLFALTALEVEFKNEGDEDID